MLVKTVADRPKGLRGFVLVCHEGRSRGLLRVGCASLFGDGEVRGQGSEEVVVVELKLLNDCCEEPFEYELEEVIHNGLIVPTSQADFVIYSVSVKEPGCEIKMMISSSLRLLEWAMKEGHLVSHLFILKRLGESLKSDQFEREVSKFLGLMIESKEVIRLTQLFEQTRELAIGSKLRIELAKTLTQSKNWTHPQFSTLFSQSDFIMPDILVVTPEFRGYSIAGGVAVMLADLLKSIQKKGHRVTVLTPYYHINQ